MDYIDSYNGGGPLYQNLRAWQYGPAGWDIKNNLVVNYLWALPRASQVFGSKSGWNNIGTREMLDGWQISGIATHLSGAPASISESITNAVSDAPAGGGDGARIVLTCDPWAKAAGTRTFGKWFNTSCVEPPFSGYAYNLVTGEPAEQMSAGTGNFEGKVGYFLPGFTNFDTALFKNWPIREKVTMQLRVETYNTFNHPEFSGVNGSATFSQPAYQAPPAGFTTPAAVAQNVPTQTGATFGQLTSTYNPRYMQIALRFDF
jgi:hypothetical protein